MIHRKNNNPLVNKDTPLQRLRNRVEGEPALKLSILDLSQDGDALVVLCSDNRMITLIRMALEKHWPGTMEVYCVLDLATGASPASHFDAELGNTRLDNARSVRYLN